MEGTMFTALFSLLVACVEDSNEPEDDSAAIDDTATPAPPALPTHWEALPSMATPRWALGCTAFGDDVYAIAGFGIDSDPYRKDVELLSKGEWTTKAPMPVARDYFVTAPRSDGSFVVIGGFSKGSPNHLLRYDPSGDEWDSAGQIANRVSLAGGTISGDRAVIAGGSYNWKDPVADTEIIDLATGESTPGAAAPEPFVYAASATIGDKLYVVGGTTNVFTLGTMDELRVYDAATDAWSLLTPFPGGPIDGHAMVALHDHLFVIGGYASASEVLSTVWRYEVATDTWTEADPLPNGVADACAVALSDRIVLVGGLRVYGDPLAEALAYVP
jgi:N-acetylneuraminic acid mutarotase